MSSELPSCQKLRHTEDVVDICTCGAEYAEGARFCHKCGRPRFETVEEEEPPVEVAAAAPAPPPVLPAAPIEINFHNSIAVRVAFLAALLACFLIAFPLPVVLAFGWMLTALMGAGFFAVYVYSRRTGESLSTRNGARMGWITGVFCFVISMVFYTVMVIAVSFKTGLAEFYREVLTGRAGPDEQVQQFLDMLATPQGQAFFVMIMVGVMFTLFTLLPVVGGALGAKVLEKD